VKQREFQEFYAASKDACLRAVVAHVGDRQLAEDLVAEAFTRAWVSWRTVGRHPAPTAWVVRTALNTRISWWRRQRREVALEDGLHVERAVVDDAGLDHDLLAALRGLPPRQREVVVFRYVLDLDTKTTARVLRIAPGTVTAHMTKALAALREHLTTSQEVGP
jgi:RNA polymerase sigma-70 factor (sigma-E family)